ncbi:glycine zipper 2TM domain-containing protein [Massilia sp. TN1-12]|uniref:glycine zipper 2TM domain-containing protein n=1 Tax=Massilia paldalensis TaxID=3377675 RepID=UPI003850BE94
MNNITTRLAARATLFAAIAMSGAVPLASQAAPQGHAQCQNCGTVVSTNTYKREAERGSGIGAVGGAVVGGLLGHQIGSGNGRTLATAAGAAAGAYGGNRIERNVKAEIYTDVRVKMARGGYRTFTEHGQSRYRNGDRVRVQNGHLVR